MQRFLYLGKGDKPLKPYDYSASRYQEPPQELEQLPIDTPVPFDEKERGN